MSSDHWAAAEAAAEVLLANARCDGFLADRQTHTHRRTHTHLGATAGGRAGGELERRKQQAAIDAKDRNVQKGS